MRAQAITALLILSLTALPAPSTPALARTPAAFAEQMALFPNDILRLLQQQGVYLKALLPLVEAQDLPRARHLLLLNQRAADSLDANGALHQQTQEAMQIWAIAFSYSSAFWKAVDSQRGAQAISAITDATAQIFAKSGIQAEVGSHVTQGLFRQMTEVLMMLEKQALPESIRALLGGLKADFGRVLSVADAGDRPQAFSAAIPVSRKLDAALEQMTILLSSASTSESVLQLQTLNELFKEFAQVRSSAGSSGSEDK